MLDTRRSAPSPSPSPALWLLIWLTGASWGVTLGMIGAIIHNEGLPSLSRVFLP